MLQKHPQQNKWGMCEKKTRAKIQLFAVNNLVAKLLCEAHCSYAHHKNCLQRWRDSAYSPRGKARILSLVGHEWGTIQECDTEKRHRNTPCLFCSGMPRILDKGWTEDCGKAMYEECHHQLTRSVPANFYKKVPSRLPEVDGSASKYEEMVLFFVAFFFFFAFLT